MILAMHIFKILNVIDKLFKMFNLLRFFYGRLSCEL
jgi:hypothetical protein